MLFDLIKYYSDQSIAGPVGIWSTNILLFVKMPDSQKIVLQNSPSLTAVCIKTPDQHKKKRD